MRIPTFSFPDVTPEDPIEGIYRAAAGFVLAVQSWHTLQIKDGVLFAALVGVEIFTRAPDKVSALLWSGYQLAQKAEGDLLAAGQVPAN